MILKIALLLVVTILAFSVSAFCGGGASLILVPILNLVLPATLVPFSLTVGTFSSSASRIVVFKKAINWKIVLGFVPFSIPAVLLGAWLMKYVDPIYLQFFVALFLIANVLVLVKSKKEQKEEERPYPKYALAVVGFLAGFISGVTGAIGLLFNRFYLRYGLSKEEIVATRAANEILLHVIKLVIYILLGLYSQTAFWIGVTVAVGAVISSFGVKYILPYVSEFLFRQIGYGAMVIAGLALFSNTSQHIINKNKVTVVPGRHETAIKWRQSNFALEYKLDDGLEVEMSILPEELPAALKVKYNEFDAQYDAVLIEKVFKFGEQPSYEFYCYIAGEMMKYDFEE